MMWKAYNSVGDLVAEGVNYDHLIIEANEAGYKVKDILIGVVDELPEINFSEFDLGRG